MRISAATKIRSNSNGGESAIFAKDFSGCPARKISKKSDSSLLRYLAEFECRFKRRFDLAFMPGRLILMPVRCRRLCYAACWKRLKLAGNQVILWQKFPVYDWRSAYSRKQISCFVGLLKSECQCARRQSGQAPSNGVSDRCLCVTTLAGCQNFPVSIILCVIELIGCTDWPNTKSKAYLPCALAETDKRYSFYQHIFINYHSDPAWH